MRTDKKMMKLVGAMILVGLLAINWNLNFNSSQSLAASPDNDLKLWYNYMAGTNYSGDPNDLNESFYKALPLGNGRIGAMVYGNCPDERIDLNECTFWSSGPSNNNKTGAANYLATAQNQIWNGQYSAADSTIGNNMLGGGEARYQSVGDLKLAFGHSSVTGYSRQLDMNTGVVSCDYTYNGRTYHRESFVSYPDQVLVTRITCSAAGSISFTASYESSLSGQYTVSTSGSDTLIMNGHGDSDNGVNYAVWFSTRSKIINTHGSISANGSGVTVTNADSVVILTAVRTNFVNYATCNGDEKGNAATDITNASAKSYTTLYDNHVADYQALFQRVDIDLGGTGSENSKPMNTRISQFGSTNDPKLVKVLFQYGRYLMITASRDSQPMNLQGIWNKFRNPAWGCKYTTNINYEMNYWPAFTTNLEECFKPFVEKAKALQTRGNETARAHYNISNGWVVHHNTDLWNRCAPIDGAWGFWPTGAGWICNMLYDAYTFNQNTTYLNDIYPTIKGSADFLQTLMQSHSWNGKTYQVICPGTSPEVQGNGVWCSFGVTMDNGICRELFKDVISASTTLNVDSSFRSTLQSKLAQIKPDTVGGWGQLQEWAFDWDNPNETNRHISFAYSLFPGQEISKRKTPTLANAVITSLQHRGDVGTGWSEGWKLNCWARLEDGAHAYNLIKLMITPASSSGRLYDNLWDAHPPFQIDGNFGFTSGVTEMLLQSHNNEIQLLPALPGPWATGHANGLRARGNFTITQMNWANGVLSSVTIKSGSGNVCNVRYGNITNSFPTTAGSSYRLNGSLQLEGGTPTPTVTPTPTPTVTPTPTLESRSAFSRIEAESYDTQSGIQTESCGEGGQNIGYIENGDYAVYNNIGFGGGAAGFQARVASANSGGTIEIRLDSITGPLVGACSVAGTGGWQNWVDATCDVSGVSGTHDLYLQFSGGSGYLFNVNWFLFTSGSVSTPTPTPGGAGVTFYQDYNYSGTAKTLKKGNYTMSQLASLGIPNDWVSSIRVPSGYTVEVYPDDNYGGTKLTFTGDVANLGSYGFNDQMSSVKIY
jgi:alpha-L-fucosidase 2